MNTKMRLVGAVAGMAGVFGSSGTAMAQVAGNADVQSFFANTVCFGTPTGLFLARCGETENNGVFADISTSSESSLNPNQTAVVASNALSTAQALAVETEERLKAMRAEDKGEPSPSGERIASFGPWSVFTSVEGEWFDQSRQAFANERGFNGDRARVTLGVDRRLGTASHLGATMSYEDYSLAFDREPDAVGFAPLASAGSHKADTFAASVFASFNLDEGGWIDVSAGYARSNNDFRRNAIFQPSTRRLALNVTTRGSANGDHVFASIGTGYDFAQGPLTFGPYVRARYARSEINGYTETEIGTPTGLNFEVPDQKATSLTAIAGLRTSYAIGATWGVFVPQARLEYEHEFEDDARDTFIQFALDPRDVPFRVTSDAPDRDHFNAGLGLVLILPGGITPFVDYEALLGYRNLDRHRITGGLRAEF